MIRIVLSAVVCIAVAACHTLPDPHDPARQKRIDDCLKQCGQATPGRENTAYPPAPSEQTDTRTPCERRCHSIP